MLSTDKQSPSKRLEEDVGRAAAGAARLRGQAAHGFAEATEAR